MLQACPSYIYKNADITGLCKGPDWLYQEHAGVAHKTTISHFTSLKFGSFSVKYKDGTQDWEKWMSDKSGEKYCRREIVVFNAKGTKEKVSVYEQMEVE